MIYATMEYEINVNSVEHLTTFSPHSPHPYSVRIINMESYRWVLVGISAVSIVFSFLLALFVFRFRQEKILRASSPSLLYLVLFGCVILQIEAILTSFPVTDFLCAILPWLFHLSFVITYGTLLLKTWRISVILRVFKARIFHTGDRELLFRLAVSLVLSIIYLGTWTATNRSVPQYPTSGVSNSQRAASCTFLWPDMLAMAVECLLLIWGGCLCFQARKAPDLYNETRQVSFTLWNEALWTGFYVFSRVILTRQADADMFVILHFLHVHSTVFVTVSLLLLPKFFVIFRRSKELHGTLTDVYGAKKVHRLSLVVNKKGEVRTIYCQPCGPLYLENDQMSMAQSPTEPQGEETMKENHYTMDEVDKLIDLVSSLKSERNLYSLHIQRLLHLLRAHNIVIPEDMRGQMNDPNLCNAQYNVPAVMHDAQVKGEGEDGEEGEDTVKEDNNPQQESNNQYNSSPSSIHKPQTVTTYASSVSEQGYGSLTTGGQNSPRHFITTLGVKNSPRHLLYGPGPGSDVTRFSAGLSGKGSPFKGPLPIHLLKNPHQGSQPLHVSSNMLQGGECGDEGIDNSHTASQVVSQQGSIDVPRLLNGQGHMDSGRYGLWDNGNNGKLHNGEVLELAHIEGKSYSPNCYRKKVFLQQKVGEGSERANFVLFI